MKYFEKIFLMKELKFPVQVWMTLEEIVIFGISSVGKGDGSDLSVEVSLGRDNVVHEADLSDPNCRTTMTPGLTLAWRSPIEGGARRVR